MAEDNRDSYNRRNQVQIDLDEYEAKNAKIGALKDEIQKMKDAAGPNKMGWMWLAPEYFSRWRIFPRAFIDLLLETVVWRASLSLSVGVSPPMGNGYPACLMLFIKTLAMSGSTGSTNETSIVFHVTRPGYHHV